MLNSCENPDIFVNKINLEVLDHLVNIFGRSGVSTQLQPWELISTMKMLGLSNTIICQRLQAQAELLTDASKRLKKLETTLKNAKSGFDDDINIFETSEFNRIVMPMFKRVDSAKMSIDEFISQLNFFNE